VLDLKEELDRERAATDEARSRLVTDGEAAAAALAKAAEEGERLRERVETLEARGCAHER